MVSRVTALEVKKDQRMKKKYFVLSISFDFHFLFRNLKLCWYLCLDDLVIKNTDLAMVSSPFPEDINKSNKKDMCLHCKLVVSRITHTGMFYITFI